MKKISVETLDGILKEVCGRMCPGGIFTWIGLAILDGRKKLKSRFFITDSSEKVSLYGR